MKKDDKVNKVIKAISMGKNELKIFGILLKKPMTIKQLIKFSRLSERTIRTCISELVKKQFIEKDALIEDQLKYIYHTNSSKSIADIIKEKLSELDK